MTIEPKPNTRGLSARHKAVLDMMPANRAMTSRDIIKELSTLFKRWKSPTAASSDARDILAALVVKSAKFEDTPWKITQNREVTPHSFTKTLKEASN
tara:strand:+ start:566 stop:856 length:291 start_codon:yes stop_codon:yes gene_type:complete